MSLLVLASVIALVYLILKERKRLKIKQIRMQKRREDLMIKARNILRDLTIEANFALTISSLKSDSYSLSKDQFIHTVVQWYVTRSKITLDDFDSIINDQEDLKV